MAFFRVGDAVRVKKDMYEWCYGIGLIIDKNPKYWFVQFPNGQMVAFLSEQLDPIRDMIHWETEGAPPSRTTGNRGPGLEP